MKNYDTFIIGQLCIDEVVGFDGTSEWSIGGAVVYSSYSALAGGNRVGILIKSSAKDKIDALHSTCPQRRYLLEGVC